MACCLFQSRKEHHGTIVNMEKATVTVSDGIRPHLFKNKFSSTLVEQRCIIREDILHKQLHRDPKEQEDP